MEDIIVIGVAGGSASGKTTVAARLKEAFKEELILICHDSYYLSHDDLPYETRCKINYDHESIDWEFLNVRPLVNEII